METFINYLTKFKQLMSKYITEKSFWIGFVLGMFVQLVLVAI